MLTHIYKNLITSQIKIMKNPTSCFYLYFLVLCFFSCAEKKTATSLEQAPNSTYAQSYLLYKNFPSQHVASRNIEIWLPEEYDQTEALPVIYMFDGQNIFHGTKGWSGAYNRGWEVDEKLDSLIKEKIIPPVIVVGIFNTGRQRQSEYMPAKPAALVERRIDETQHDWDQIFKEIPPQSDAFLKFITTELKPFVDSHYKTKPDRANTYVAGSSFGGMISAYAICEYPEIIGGAACFSTHWIPMEGVFLEYIKSNLPDPATHKIYFDYGTEGLDAEYEPFQLIADLAMQEKGFEKNKNWMTVKYEGATHHEKSWRSRFHIPMQFLLKEDK